MTTPKITGSTYMHMVQDALEFFVRTNDPQNVPPGLMDPVLTNTVHANWLGALAEHKRRTHMELDAERTDDAEDPAIGPTLTPEQYAAAVRMIVNGTCVPEPDEPFFVLLGRDRAAPETLGAWASNRSRYGQYEQDPHNDNSTITRLVMAFSGYRLKLDTPAVGTRWRIKESIREAEAWKRNRTTRFFADTHIVITGTSHSFGINYANQLGNLLINAEVVQCIVPAGEQPPVKPGDVVTLALQTFRDEFEPVPDEAAPADDIPADFAPQHVELTLVPTEQDDNVTVLMDGEYSAGVSITVRDTITPATTVSTVTPANFTDGTEDL